MKKKLFLYTLILITTIAIAQNLDTELKLNSKYAIIIDYRSGETILEKNANEIVKPASMTKLVTIYTALKILKQNQIPLTTEIKVHSQSDFRNTPPHSSLMFLQAGQKVTIEELIKGLTVSSGNDAAIELAIICKNTIPNFLQEMNQNMTKLNLENSHFYDTSGYSAKNQITVKEFAHFCKQLILEFPEILKYTSLTDFTYPKTKNIGNTEAIYGTIKQYNHNELIGKVKYVDGLKTGFIEESGNNIALTAKKNDTRFIAVLSGIHDQDTTQRSKKRLSDGKKIVNYIFQNYETIEIPAPQIKNIKIKNGKKKYTNSTKNKNQKKLINKKNKNKILRSYKLNPHLKAPIKEDTIIGYWNYSINNKTSENFPLYADTEIKKGNIFKRIIH